MVVPLRTLIVANDPHTIQGALHELRCAGFSPTWDRVESAEDFLSQLTPPPDLILADYNLPHIDASHALRLLQERKLHIPFILLSDPIGDELVAAIIKQGADDFLLKGHLARLGPAVADALEQHRLRDENLRAQQQAEAALRASEARFAAAFRASPACLTITSLNDYKFRDVNDSFLKMLGYQRTEVVGRTSLDLNMFANPAERDRVLRLSRAEGGAHAYELELRTKAGESRTVLFSTAEVEFDGEPGVLAMLFDNTDRKQAEQALARERTILQASIEGMGDGLIVSDVSGKFLVFNQSAERILGVGLTDAAPDQWAQQYGIFQPNSETQFPSEELPLVRALQGETIDGMELFVRHSAAPDGLYISVNANPLRDSSGTVWGGIAVFRDITERKQAEQAVLRRNAELAALTEMGQALSRLVEPAELLQVIRKVVGQVFGSKDLAIILYDAPSQTLSFELFTVAGRHTPPPSRRIANGLADYVIHRRQPLYLPRDVKQSAAAMGIEHLGQDVASILAVPLLAGDHVLGAIALHDFEHENIYDTGHVEVLTTIAAQAAIALENARLFAETEQLARTDALTGVANRRVLFEAGERELSRARRFSHPLSAVMLDIDYFKQVNDTRGHAVGDQVLRLVARCCLEQVRDSDVVARYGGEEFAILCLETDLAGARISAERLRAHVARLVCVSDQGPFNVTISLGVAHAQAESGGFSVLLEHADRALYAAKQAGRNRVEAA